MYLLMLTLAIVPFNMYPVSVQAFYIAIKELDLLHEAMCSGLACTRDGEAELIPAHTAINRFSGHGSSGSNVTVASASCTYTRIALCPPGQAVADDGSACLPSYGVLS